MTVVPAEPILIRSLVRSPLRHLRLGHVCQSRPWLLALPLSRRTYAAAANRNTGSNNGSYEASRQAQQVRCGTVVSRTPCPSSPSCSATSNMLMYFTGHKCEQQS